MELDDDHGNVVDDARARLAAELLLSPGSADYFAAVDGLVSAVRLDTLEQLARLRISDDGGGLRWQDVVAKQLQIDEEVSTGD